MKLYFCAETRGFYLDPSDAPSSCVEVSMDEHQALFQKQGDGAEIQADENGRPIAVFPVPDVDAVVIARAVEAARQAAYTAEADPLFFKAQRGEATMEEWQAKIDEIKARYPEGVMPVVPGIA